MILLDEPYASEPLLTWMEETQHPVRRNEFVEGLAKRFNLNMVDDEETANRINKGERVYTNSENALAWILENTDNLSLREGIETFKDKAAMRKALAPLNPDLFYKTMSADELANVDFSQLPVPFVLKPSVGFCSMGVYAIQNEDDWNNALADIAQSAESWKAMYPESVVGTETYILEGYITGTEYALDAYFDEQGKAHMLNVLRHDFMSPEDTSDRMYVTSAPLVREMAPLFKSWLDQVNEIIGVRNFPVHVEVRVADGKVTPIEFNPLRFAGLGGTDVALYGYGYRTYEAFLDDKPVDFDAAFAGKDDKVYTMSLLNPPSGITGKETFDYDAFCARFNKVLEMREYDVNRVGNYGFLFIETERDNPAELDFLMHTDLVEFLK